MSPVWHLFPITVPLGTRNEFRAHLHSLGVDTGVHYPTIIPEQEAMKGTKFEVAGELKNARHFADCEVSLPIHPFLSAEELRGVVDACNSWNCKTATAQNGI